MARVRFDVAYDGSGFHGFAENPEVVTVGGTLRAAIEQVLGHPIELVCAGRTDRGVHATGQVVSFDARLEQMTVEELGVAVTRICGPRLVVTRAAIAPDHFDARFSATSRRYQYSVLSADVPDPLTLGTTWHVPYPLSLPVMRLACDPLIGEHDFTSFCRVPKHTGEPPSMVRRVIEAGWTDLGRGRLRFDIRATGFCHQMVRSLVGMLVAIGRGRRSAGEMLAVLSARDRSFTETLAPPHGLVLVEVGYDI